MNIPIFFSSNDYYIPYVSVMMQSIMENAKNGRKYDFYILHIDIKNETMGNLQKQVNSFPDFSINFVDMSPFVKDYDFFISRHVTAETYFRLFIPYMFSNIDKAIYLDGDMVCLTDISELFDFDVSNYLVGGVRDVGIAWYFLPKKYKTDSDKKNYEYLSTLENPSGYINAGMLLINCEKFREAYSQKNVIDTVFSRKWQVHDQDVINFLAKDKILHLDYEWDYMNMPNNYVRYLPQNFKDKYIAAKKNPKIIHYKPYAVWYYIPYFYEFWKYAARTPFIKKIVARMDKSGLSDINIENNICTAVRTKEIGGMVILKAILTFFAFRFYQNNTDKKQKG